jgi:hypothetical protein
LESVAHAAHRSRGRMPFFSATKIVFIKIVSAKTKNQKHVLGFRFLKTPVFRKLPNITLQGTEGTLGTLPSRC